MILTYKIKHGRNFSAELKKAKQVAKFAIKNRDKLSSKYVTHIGLKSAISNAVLYKYGRNRGCEEITKVVLTVPGQHVKCLPNSLKITSLRLEFPFDKPCQKINQVELDREYCYVAVTVRDEPQFKVKGWLGVDRNTTGHCAVAACTTTNQVLFLGKKSQHIHNKYKNIRKKLQRLNKLKKLTVIKRRESNIQRELNHKISRKLVNYAKTNQCGIRLEDLEGIRKHTKTAKSFKYSLNSWAYYQLQQFVDYKAQLAGVPTSYIAPQYTSQMCHQCGLLGIRDGKSFKCPHCGYTAHADANAAWNIAYSRNYRLEEVAEGKFERKGTWQEQLLVEPHPERCCISGLLWARPHSIYNQRLARDEDLVKGNTDIPQKALVETPLTLEPAIL